GKTEFPHLHFQVERYTNVIDPFVGLAFGYDCDNASSRVNLWDAEAKLKAKYHPTGILGVGFTTQPPTKEEVQAGYHRATELSGNDEMMVFWAELFGIRRGDRLYLSLQDPKGNVLAQTDEVFDRSKAQIFYYVGKRNTKGLWPPGIYTAWVQLLRAPAKDQKDWQKVIVKRTTIVVGQ
ncbi:MAG: hypothetical protein ACPG80_04530, partial [Rickettsiales bacterium]